MGGEGMSVNEDACVLVARALVEKSGLGVGGSAGERAEEVQE